MIAATVTNGNSSREVTPVFAAGWSGMVGSIYILFHPWLRETSFRVVVLEFILGHTLLRISISEEWSWGRKVDPSKKKNWKDQGVGHEFCSVNRENLWDRYTFVFLCVYVCVCTTSFLSLFFLFFRQMMADNFFPPGREGIGVLTQLVWGEVWSKDLCCARVIK